MTPDLKTLRSVAEGATPGPWVAGTVPRPHAWDRAFVRVVTDLPDGGRITVYPAACESTTLDNAANAAFIAAANPQAILSLLDRVEALEADKARLDFLDEANTRLNAKYGTTYRWKLIMNHNVNRLMIGHLDVDLNDAEPNALKSCRDAIDERMREVGAARATLKDTPNG